MSTLISLQKKWILQSTFCNGSVVFGPPLKELQNVKFFVWIQLLILNSKNIFVKDTMRYFRCFTEKCWRRIVFLSQFSFLDTHILCSFCAEYFAWMLQTNRGPINRDSNSSSHRPGEGTILESECWKFRSSKLSSRPWVNTRLMSNLLYSTTSAAQLLS